MWTTQKLKDAFFDYFKQKQHVVLPSSSVVPNNDPTLLFTNSGMVQFKNNFLGESPKHKRVVTSQRCIRAGGKHNDLDDVGKDNYHHTFFEMLGNWSFDDYFKEEAIEYAYDFLINVLKLKKENMYVTIYEDMDQESSRIWSKYVDPSRIIPSGAKDNFWEMGEYGPCGPCTEIHYDRIGNRDASQLVNKDDPTVIEIWNIVFMEYERTPKGLEKLQIKHIDTGIGLERLLSILIDVPSNYLIDSFQNIIKYIEGKCEFVYEDRSSTTDIAFRVLADHSRTMAVCLNDRVAFASDGVGYVLRRILRRAVRYAHDVLKLKKGNISQFVKQAAQFMDLEIDVSVIDQEEDLFLTTLVKGLNQLMKMAETKGRLDGGDIFILYDTYGFPCDLTQLVCEEKKISYSLEGFEQHKLQAKELSKSTKKFITINFTFPKTDDSFKYTVNGISAILQAAIYNNEIVECVPENTLIDLVFDKTCFYGESGGQVGDRGTIEFYESNTVVGTFIVDDTQIRRGFVCHEGKLIGRLGKTAVLTYDEKNRSLIRANHSTVHLINHFLRKYIKTSQQGSYVDADKCRFDFDSKKLSDDVIDGLEERINAFVQTNASVEVTTHPRDEVLQDSSVISMGDEEYPQLVRVITMKNKTETVKEICGGTHVNNTSDIKLVRILSESGVKVNTRRIVAVSNEKALEVDANAKKLLDILHKGEVVTYDCQLSISQKREIDLANKTNAKIIQKNFDEVLKNLKISIADSLINCKVSNLMKMSVFSYECEPLAKFNKKEVIKALIGLLAVTDSTECFLFVKLDDLVHFVAKAKELTKIFDKISSFFPSASARIIKDSIQGTVSIDEFISEKMMKVFD